MRCSAAGFVARLQEEYQTATTLLDEGLTLARATGHTFIAAACLHHLGMIAGDVHHDNAAARRLLEESLALYRALDFPRFIALVQLSLGTVALAEADLDRAHDMLRQSLTGMAQIGEKLGIHGALDTFGHLAIAQGRHRASRQTGRRRRPTARHQRHPILAGRAANPCPMAGLQHARRWTKRHTKPHGNRDRQ